MLLLKKEFVRKLDLADDWVRTVSEGDSRI